MLEKLVNRVQAGELLAEEVAKKYNNDKNDVIILALPSHEELAMGAITETSSIFNEDIIDMLHIKQESINRVMKREGYLYIPEETVITSILSLVVHSFAFSLLIYHLCHTSNPKKIVIAVPVASPDTLTKMSKEIDDIICLLVPRNLGGIGAWYQDFTQTEDKEVLELLEKSDRDFPVPTISAEETAKLQNEAIIE
ncbi:2557_t:CDS:2 [Racocetra fulgida]|uniref:2557_t:CDS:1 n=1 Tax=Racocetra fulgida TaxID=60492 RepID=A0A9N9GGG2_9GLOM|nr:2557_t:CDS:2 [Racocetra fulgida]